MNHPSKPGSFKVVVNRAGFFVAPVSDTRLPETNASQKERARLATRVGYINNELPGLLEQFAMRLARKLQAGRRNRQKARRRA